MHILFTSLGVIQYFSVSNNEALQALLHCSFINPLKPTLSDTTANGIAFILLYFEGWSVITPKGVDELYLGIISLSEAFFNLVFRDVMFFLFAIIYMI